MNKKNIGILIIDINAYAKQLREGEFTLQPLYRELEKMGYSVRIDTITRDLWIADIIVTNTNLEFMIKELMRFRFENSEVPIIMYSNNPINEELDFFSCKPRTEDLVKLIEDLSPQVYLEKDKFKVCFFDCILDEKEDTRQYKEEVIDWFPKMGYNLKHVAASRIFDKHHKYDCIILHPNYSLKEKDLKDYLVLVRDTIKTPLLIVSGGKSGLEILYKLVGEDKFQNELIDINNLSKFIKKSIKEKIVRNKKKKSLQNL